MHNDYKQYIFLKHGMLNKISKNDKSMYPLGDLDICKKKEECSTLIYFPNVIMYIFK